MYALLKTFHAVSPLYEFFGWVQTAIEQIRFCNLLFTKKNSRKDLMTHVYKSLETRDQRGEFVVKKLKDSTTFVRSAPLTTESDSWPLDSSSNLTTNNGLAILKIVGIVVRIVVSIISQLLVLWHWSGNVCIAVGSAIALIVPNFIRFKEPTHIHKFNS